MSTETPSADAVVFDVGNVLVDVNYRYLYRQLLPTDEDVETFLTTICTQDWHVDHDRGLPMAQGVAALIEQHPEHAELIQAWDTRFHEVWKGPIDGSVAIAAELRERQVPLFLLTNWPAEKWPMARQRFAFLDEFGGALVSGEVGLVKPEPAIFELLCRRFNLEPARTVFIDDAPKNVEAAKQLGFHALLFTSPEQLRADLQGLGLLG
jgi:2-haloacid dehalogenase